MKLSISRCSFDGLLDVKMGQIIKIIRAVIGSNPLRASVIENLTTGQKQRSKIEGVMMANEHVQLANPIIGRVIRELDDHSLILKDIDPRAPLEDVGNTYKIQTGYTTHMGEKFLIGMKDKIKGQMSFNTFATMILYHML